jgi:hypothetical protein
MRWYRRVTVALVVLVGIGAVLSHFCRRDQREAIRVGEGRVVVTNLTGTRWTSVDVWLNQYYRAQTEALAPDQRLEVPLTVFVDGYGQRFKPHLQQAAGVEVTARGANGERIRLTWGNGRHR